MCIGLITDFTFKFEPVPITMRIDISGCIQLEKKLSKPIEIQLVEDNPVDICLTNESRKDGRVLNHLNVASDGAKVIASLLQKGACVGYRSINGYANRVFKNISNRTDPCAAVNDILGIVETTHMEDIPPIKDLSKTGVNAR